MNTRASLLAALYGSDSALGVSQDEEADLAVLPDGGHATRCGDCAHYIRSLEPNTAVYGFWSKDNPSWAGARLVDGHDFALVEERYIVDPWIVETEHLSDRAVFDLHDPADAAEIHRIYGDRRTWRIMAGPSIAAKRR